MNWADVIAPPSARTLRQFAGLWLGFLTVAALLRWVRGHHDLGTAGLLAAALLVGVTGLVVPRAIRYVYTAAMLAAFPLGWTVSRVALVVVFYLVFTPIAWTFRLGGRDLLRRRRTARESYWIVKPPPGGSADYFRQS